MPVIKSDITAVVELTKLSGKLKSIAINIVKIFGG